MDITNCPLEKLTLVYTCYLYRKYIWMKSRQIRTDDEFTTEVVLNFWYLWAYSLYYFFPFEESDFLQNDGDDITVHSVPTINSHLHADVSVKPVTAPTETKRRQDSIMSTLLSWTWANCVILRWLTDRSEKQWLSEYRDFKLPVHLDSSSDKNTELATRASCSIISVIYSDNYFPSRSLRKIGSWTEAHM